MASVVCVRGEIIAPDRQTTLTSERVARKSGEALQAGIVLKFGGAFRECSFLAEVKLHAR